MPDDKPTLPEYPASVEVEDEEITPETAARFDRARASNESIPQDDILREFGLKKLSSVEPQGIGVTSRLQGQADLRAIDRETARGILHCLDRFIKNRESDIKNLKPPRTDYRLRCNDYRLFFDFVVYETRDGRISIYTINIRITAVLHRREAYR
jgi:hypothetical protein